uniref:Uncharacterized protein n=1 Tax=Anguilla anguilla TaxID=7936 RepID=A0A0E9UXS5_ANGAN
MRIAENLIIVPVSFFVHNGTTQCYPSPIKNDI